MSMMSNDECSAGCIEKRRSTAALHNASEERGAKITATSWSAAVLCRLEWALDYCERVEPLTQIRFSFRGNRDVSDEGDIRETCSNRPVPDNIANSGCGT